MKKLGFLLFIILVVISSLLMFGLAIGCSGEQTDVTFAQLFDNPNKYAGRQVSIEGYYYHGFETIVMSERLDYSGYAEGHLIPKGLMLWIEGGIPEEVFDGLQQQMMGPVERYGKLRITGTFEYGGKYGHLGQFEYQIKPSQVELISWVPNLDNDLPILLKFALESFNIIME